MIRDERSYELSCLPYWCVSHHRVHAISFAEPLGFCMYSVGPASHMPSRFVLLPVPCLPALLLFLHPHLLHLCFAATCSVVQIIYTHKISVYALRDERRHISVFPQQMALSLSSAPFSLPSSPFPALLEFTMLSVIPKG